jgi:arginine:ornithine antiporter / lysine permease
MDKSSVTSAANNVEGDLSFPLLIALVEGSIVGIGIFALPQNMSVGAGSGAIIIGWLIISLGMLALARVHQTLALHKPSLNLRRRNRWSNPSFAS